MTDDADKIRRLMQSIRQDADENVEEIVSNARELVDWKHYVRRHPWWCVSSAVALGILVTPGRRAVLQSAAIQAGGPRLGASPPLAASAVSTAGGWASQLLSFAAPIVIRLAIQAAKQGLVRSDSTSTSTDSGAANCDQSHS